MIDTLVEKSYYKEITIIRLNASYWRVEFEYKHKESFRWIYCIGSSYKKVLENLQKALIEYGLETPRKA